MIEAAALEYALSFVSFVHWKIFAFLKNTKFGHFCGFEPWTGC
jgi:hypothetical protein